MMVKMMLGSKLQAGIDQITEQLGMAMSGKFDPSKIDPEAFAEEMKKNTHSICVTISRNLSGTYNAAVQGAEMAKEENLTDSIPVKSPKKPRKDKNRKRKYQPLKNCIFISAPEFFIY